MKSAIQMVTEFHRKHGQPVFDRVIEAGQMGLRAALRSKLVTEEAKELRDALQVNDLGEWTGQKPDVRAVADALGDIIYVTVGTAIEFGIPLVEVFAEVHRSNMTKTPGNVRGDGKILKGPDWSPPNLVPILWPSSPGAPADPVNHPPHYKVAGVECIDVIEALGLGFNLGNALKYLWRAGRKDRTKTVEDLKKARFYIDRHIAKLERDLAGGDQQEATKR